jgi:hypothetical protein
MRIGAIPEYYKLTENELRSLVTDCRESPFAHDVSDADVDRILEASRARTPGQFADEVVKVPLNRAGTVQVRSIHFYGGEHFGKPHHFLAEVVSLTTNSCFSRFLNATGTRWIRKRLSFTY